MNSGLNLNFRLGLLAFLLGGLLVAGCTDPSDPNSAIKASLKTCDHYEHVVRRVTAMTNAGLLDVKTITRADQAIQTMAAYCTQPVPGAPTQGVIDALDQLLIIIATEVN